MFEAPLEPPPEDELMDAPELLLEDMEPLLDEVTAPDHEPPVNPPDDDDVDPWPPELELQWAE